MSRSTLIQGIVLWSVASVAQAALTFTPAPGYTAQTVWSGGGVSHFAVEGSNLYMYGAEEVTPGQFQSVVRLFDGASTVEIARSPMYGAGDYSPDAITVVNGDVYWANAQSFANGANANLLKTTFDGTSWTTSTVFDESAGFNIYSLSTDGSNVFGVGLGALGNNEAFYLDSSDTRRVFAELPGGGSGGSGFDPDGNFFAGSWSVGGDFASHMYSYSSTQVADRVAGTQSTPFAAGDALADLVVPSNASSVMESDGSQLFGTSFNTSFTGTNPFAFDMMSGVSTSLGEMSGAGTTVAADLYARDGAVYFLGKDAWGTGTTANIYRLTPEPSSLLLLLCGGAMLRRRSRQTRSRQNG